MSAPDSLRAELARLVDDAPVAGERLPQVHARARRIRRNRTAAALTSAVAAVVVAVLVATNVAGTNRSVDPLAPSPTKVPTGVLLVDRDGTVGSLPSMTDRALQPVRDLRLGRNATPLPVAAGRALAYDAAHDLVLVDPKQPGSARILLRHTDAVAHNIPFAPRGTSMLWMAIPGVGPRLLERMLVERGGARVWLVTTATKAALGGGPYELYAMDLAGHVDPRAIRLPKGAVPVVVGKTGTYVETRSGSSRFAGPNFSRVDGSGRLRVVFRDTDSGPPGNGYGEVVLQTCPTHFGGCSTSNPRMFDADTGHVVRLPAKAPHGGFLYLVQPPFSVDGRYFVDELGAALPMLTRGKDFDNGFAWVVVDTATGQETLVPGSLRRWVNRNALQIAGWSGDRLVWTEQLAHRTVIGAYLPANGRSVITSVPTRGLALLGAS